MTQGIPCSRCGVVIADGRTATQHVICPIDVTSMGRGDLLDELTRLHGIVTDLSLQNRHMFDNLTATQARCTELLEEVRAARRDAEPPPPTSTEEVWGYSESEFGVLKGECPTREAAIAEGMEELTDSFWIARGRHPDPARYFNVYKMFDDAADIAMDEAGDATSSWPYGALSLDKMNEFAKLVHTWMRKHAPCRFWVAVGEPEFIFRAVKRDDPSSENN